MLALHVSDLIGPSSGAFCRSCIRRLWYVVIRVLLDTSSRCNGWTCRVVCEYSLYDIYYIYYKMIHGPYNIKLIDTHVISTH